MGQRNSARRRREVSKVRRCTFLVAGMFLPLFPRLVCKGENGDCAVQCRGGARSCRVHQAFRRPMALRWAAAGHDLLPGDGIFTGPLQGLGLVPSTGWFMQSAKVLASRIEGIGEGSSTFALAGQAPRVLLSPQGNSHGANRERLPRPGPARQRDCVFSRPGHGGTIPV